METTHTLFAVRHLAARDPIFPGKELQIPNLGPFKAGLGVHPDGEAHLLGTEFAKAELLGETLSLGKGINSFLLAPSPLARAVETARHLFVGLARRFAADSGILDLKKDVHELSMLGLHTLAQFRVCNGVNEPEYRNSQGQSDQGNEIVGEAILTNSKEFPGYQYIVEQGFRGDPRVEHPTEVAERGLRELLDSLVKNDVVLTVSHQPNMELFAATLTGSHALDARSVWNAAGGEFALGGGFIMSACYDPSTARFVSAKLLRTPVGKEIPAFEEELPINLEVLNSFLAGESERAHSKLLQRSAPVEL